MLHHPEQFERYLAAAFIRLQKVYNLLHGCLCRHHRTGERVNDFDDPVLFGLVKVYEEYRDMTMDAGGLEHPVPTEEDIRCAAVVLAAEGDATVNEDIEEIVEAFMELTSPVYASNDLLESTVLPVAQTWMTNKKSQAAIVDIRRSGMDPDISDRVAELEEIRDICNAGSSGDMFDEFDCGEDDSQAFVERMTLGSNFSSLNACLGGGVGKKEHILFAAPTGQGKTVLACQLAADLASSGHQVLFITTEQPSIELRPRIISCLSKGPGMEQIPFGLVKDGGYRHLLSDGQRRTHDMIQESLRGKLHFQSWLGMGKSINDIDAIVQAAIKKYSSIDVVVLDWIGGALTENVDPKFKRDEYLKAAKRMKTIAYKFDIATISFAQTTQDSIDKQRVTEKYLAECKTLHTECAAAFGISALRTTGSSEAAASDSQNAYATEQFMYCFKSRKAVGKLIPIRRDFGFQRFTGM